MPSNSSRRTLARQWELLKLLPSKPPGLPASDLLHRLQEAGHDTSKRTVERDLIELSQLFPLQCNDKGMPYGWYWIPGSATELPGLSLSDALTLQLMEGSLRPLIPNHLLKTLEPRFQQARLKLQSLSEEIPTASWLDKVATVHPELALLPPVVDETHLEAVQEALLHNKQLECSYYAAHKDRQHEFTLNPLALVQRGQVTYLLATVEPFEDIRQFALHRFSAVEQSSLDSTKPDNFSLKTYLASGAMQFGTPAKIMIEAWISEGLSRLLAETPISSDMLLIPEEDGANLTATVNDSWELRWWILSHAGSIQIRSPNSLANEITQRLQNALNLQRMELDT
ncbi:TPA: helix-turn-helix transcriptional regulator [Pseudomonas aeruginosa]|nr:WYL domain-containing protein [Pseudomonas aeruginosa]